MADLLLFKVLNGWVVSIECLGNLTGALVLDDEDDNDDYVQ